MNNRRKWWIPLVVPPLQLLRHLLSGLYAVTFAPLDRRAARKREARFAVDVSAALAAVLGKDAYRVIPNFDTIFPPSFDYAYTTVAFEGFYLRFLRGRGEFDALVAPAFSRSDWHDLSLVLGVVRGDNDVSRQGFRDVWDVARSLRPYLNDVSHVFAPERFAELRRRLDREVYVYERFANRQWEAETNTKLYGPD